MESPEDLKMLSGQPHRVAFQGLDLDHLCTEIRK